MTDETAEKPAEEFMERAGEIAMTWIDITPIAQALQDAYQRGLADGAIQVDTAQVANQAYESGRADMRAEILASLTGSAAKEAPARLPIDTTGNRVVDKVEDLTVKTASHEDLDKWARQTAVPGVPANARPEGIPSTFQMFQIVLREMPGKLTAKELVAELARRWWPGLKFERLSPDISTSVTKGRIHRDQDGRLRLTEKGDKIDATDNRGMAKGAQPPQPKQAEIPKPRANGQHGTGRLFIANGFQPVSLLPAEWTVADTLYKAMGKGFVDVGFLATKIWGHARGQDTQGKIDQLIATLNPKLIEIGLRTEYHRGFGYVMKEIT